MEAVFADTDGDGLNDSRKIHLKDRPDDILVIHDPQPLGMGALVKRELGIPVEAPAPAPRAELEDEVSASRRRIHGVIDTLQAEEEQLTAEFRVFFPELMEFVQVYCRC